VPGINGPRFASQIGLQELQESTRKQKHEHPCLLGAATADANVAAAESKSSEPVSSMDLPIDVASRV
jgi:hypothetical protein